MINISDIAIILNVEGDMGNIEDCLDSIIYQSSNNIEIFCVNNSKNNRIFEFVKQYTAHDNRFKIVESQFNFNNVSSEYCIFLTTNDWLNLRSLKSCYEKAKKEDLDILIFNLLIYENGAYKKDSFFDVFQYKKEFIPLIFNHEDIYDMLFDIPKVPFNKMFKTDLLKKIYDNYNFSFFNDYLLFFETMLNANRISFIECDVYIKRGFVEYTKLPINILNGLVNCCNDIINIFEKNNLMDSYKELLFNYKIDWIKFWYFFINEEYRLYSFDYIRTDFLNMKKNKKYIVSDYLNLNNKLFFNNIIKSNSINEFELIYKNYNLNKSNEFLIKENNEINKEINGFKEHSNKMGNWSNLINNLQDELYLTLNRNIDNFNEQINHLNNIIDEKNVETKRLGQVIDEKNVENKDLINLLNEKNVETKRLGQVIDEKNVENKDLINLLNEKNVETKRLGQVIDEKNVENEYLKGIIRKNSILIAKLNQRNLDLNEKINYTVNKKKNSTSFLNNIKKWGVKCLK